MREYKITKGDLGFHVFRRREEYWLEEVEWLQNDSFTKRREHARTFYHLSDAESGMVLAKIKSRWETPTTSIEKSDCEDGKEKRSWYEL